MNMVELIQTISKNQMDAEKPMQLMFGTVVSDGEPLRVRLSEKVVLEEEMLIRTSGRRYERGTMAVSGGTCWRSPVTTNYPAWTERTATPSGQSRDSVRS